MHYVRLLNTRDVEFYEIFQAYCGDSLGYILIIDTRRPSKFTDNPIISKVEEEEKFESASNFIKVIIITREEQSEQFKEEVHLFVSGLIETKPDSSFFMDIIVSDKEPTYDYPFDMVPMVDYIKPFLKGVNDNIDFSSLTNEKFNYLSQD
ncbi:hypothetical protein ABR335_03105 [Heyndrickxia faecalis]|uniref:Uncharacterized protein n=1 Tax=Heyndrickxia faecalis TaxID=2824910 RepID=A0AAU7WLB4_9BACI